MIEHLCKLFFFTQSVYSKILRSQTVTKNSRKYFTIKNSYLNMENG